LVSSDTILSPVFVVHRLRRSTHASSTHKSPSYVSPSVSVDLHRPSFHTDMSSSSFAPTSGRVQVTNAALVRLHSAARSISTGAAPQMSPPEKPSPLIASSRSTSLLQERVWSSTGPSNEQLVRGTPRPTSAAADKAVRLFKTEYCRSWSQTRSCPYESKCQFAHGASELRQLDRHPMYRTEKCKKFHQLGVCPYGTRCHFIHDEMTPAPADNVPLPLPLLTTRADQFAPPTLSDLLIPRLNRFGGLRTASDGTDEIMKRIETFSIAATGKSKLTANAGSGNPFLLTVAQFSPSA